MHNLKHTRTHIENHESSLFCQVLRVRLMPLTQTLFSASNTHMAAIIYQRHTSPQQQTLFAYVDDD